MSEESPCGGGKPSYRIIIPVFNPPATFLDVLATLESGEPGVLANVIVVDDGSTNGTLDQLSAEHPEVEVIRGSGDLWWCGGMREGMARALEHGVDVAMWLNHDVVPDPGTVGSLVERAAGPGVGAVSAWCYCREDRRFGVNPGFRSLAEIPTAELEGEEEIEVDGVNGNCTAISTAAIRQVGLPRADLHPHYGDGPYTWRLHQAGFRNLVLTRRRAALEREFERCIDESDHSAVWQVPLLEKLRYYFFSNRSKYHWRHRFHDIRVFRGNLLAIPAYLGAQLRLVGKVLSGHRELGQPLDERIDRIVSRYSGRFPPDALREALERQAGRLA